MHDLIVIGAGPAGGWASQVAKKEGLDTLLIEKGHMGGVCLNEGCIPSKTLLNSAKIYSHAKHGEPYGVLATGLSFDIGKAMARKEKIIGALRRGSENSKKRMGIPVIRETAVIEPPRDNAFQVRAGQETYQGKRLLICTGSEAVRLPIPGADRPFVHTNREILAIDFVPEKLVIVGGGIIGLEFATFFAEIGSRVTVVEMLPTIAGPLDNDIRKVLRRELEKKGITFKLQAKVKSIVDHAVVYETAEGAEETCAADIVLMSVGRRPATAGLGLENVHVQTDRAAVKTDERGRTNVPNIWAAGDVNGKSMLAHTASREVEVCIDDMLERPSRVNYDTIPGVIYTHPEAATVGLTAEQARERGYDVVEQSAPLTYNGRYLAETNGERGTIKAVVDRTYGTVLGVHMIGVECSEMIHAATVMIESELRVKDVRDIVFAHPTVAEMIKDTIAEIKL